jgi:ketosteroid isomerase-like protein
MYPGRVYGVNNGDVNEIISVQTPNGTEVNVFGVFKAGSPERANRAQLSKKAGIDLKSQVTDVQPLAGGNAAIATGTFEVSFKEPPGQAKGNFLGVIEKQGAEWKLPALSLTPQPPPKQ